MTEDQSVAMDSSRGRSYLSHLLLAPLVVLLLLLQQLLHLLLLHLHYVLAALVLVQCRKLVVPLLLLHLALYVKLQLTSIKTQTSLVLLLQPLPQLLHLYLLPLLQLAATI